MPKPLQETSQPELASLSETVVALIERPAAVVVDGDEILAHNAPWSQVTRCSIDPAQHDTLERSLRNFDAVDTLVAALRRGTQSVGVVTLLRTPDVDVPEARGRAYVARWRQIEFRPVRRSFTVVVLQDPTATEHTATVMAAQQAQITHLLIRQTLIEEKERRRLGQAMHDILAQELAQIRAMVLSNGHTIDKGAPVIAKIDRVIEAVRTLSFELSPPVLEDLGLRPALRWLAEHLSKRYGTPITVVEDANEPELSKPTRTIVFRAVRELLINAAKHAPGAEIIISCVTNEHTARFRVRDTGPGIAMVPAHLVPDGVHHYGLLSIEQQVRGVGGSFDLVSNIGEGTRATITVPIEPQELHTYD